jgi:alpha-beta hydrolase superfamily lysophospholipase
MKKYLGLLTVLPFSILFLSCAISGNRKPQSDSSFILESVSYESKTPLVNAVELRTGIFFEAKSTYLKGCVIYLEGLADSILNHRPLFGKLSASGYRVITFDYMGQGGSGGTMNHTRIYDPLFPKLEIGNQARLIWDRYNNLKGENGRDCSQSKKLILGWSTGGLAAYKLAYDGWADAVVLIAPGIHPKKLVGEAAQSPSLVFTGGQVITERTLTRNKFEGQANPHTDAIKPISPFIVPLFAKNLLVVSELSQSWKIPQKVQGLVFLSGEEDTYVDREATKRTLGKKAPHFKTVSYDGALHEIDNEIPAVADDMHTQTIRFFDLNSTAH